MLLIRVSPLVEGGLGILQSESEVLDGFSELVQLFLLVGVF